MDYIIEFKDVSKSFKINRNILSKKSVEINAVNNVSFVLARGEILGLVGESGSGKTTIAKLLQGLYMPESGEIILENKKIKEYSRKELALKIQMIFQDPYTSLNPKLTVGTILKECIKVRFSILKQKPSDNFIYEQLKEILYSVGLNSDAINSYPHQFSGGQKQRIAIARALALKPEIIIADEPVSHLDITLQSQIIDLFLNLKKKYNLSYLFISHDLMLVASISDRILVINQGKIIEENESKLILKFPQQEYTKKLINSIPKWNI